jgi:hypothetical protein
MNNQGDRDDDRCTLSLRERQLSQTCPQPTIVFSSSFPSISTSEHVTPRRARERTLSVLLPSPLRLDGTFEPPVPLFGHIVVAVLSPPGMQACGWSSRLRSIVQREELQSERRQTRTSVLFGVDWDRKSIQGPLEWCMVTPLSCRPCSERNSPK